MLDGRGGSALFLNSCLAVSGEPPDEAACGKSLWPPGRQDAIRAAMDSPRIARLSRILFWVAAVFAVTMAVLPHPPALPTDAWGDKFQHVMAFAVLAALASMGWPRAPWWKVLGLLSLLGAGIELVQAIPQLHRDADVRDWIADTLAVLAVMAAATLIIRRPKSR